MPAVFSWHETARSVWIVRYCRGQVPFTDVLELVRGLKVYVHRGFAFVPQPEFVVIVLNVFRSKLSHALVVSLFFHIVIIEEGN